MKPIPIPNKPYMAETNKKKNLQCLIELIISKSVKIRLDIKVIATIIIIIGETIPADTAASPKTKAPRIDVAEP